MTVQTRTAPAAPFAFVVADTADWLADKLAGYEARGISQPGGADRFRQRAQDYRSRPHVLPGITWTQGQW